jgi:hypothetical protein
LCCTRWRNRQGETQVPHAQIIRIPQADHNVFQRKEADALRDMNAFISGLQANSGDHPRHGSAAVTEPLGRFPFETRLPMNQNFAGAYDQ